VLNFRRYWPLIPIAVIFAAAVSREWSNKNAPQPPLYAAASQTPSLAASQPPQQAIGIEADQQTNGPAKGTNNTQNPSGQASQRMSAKDGITRIDSAATCDYQCQRATEQRSEYWTIFGHQLKITDSLLALSLPFCLLLALFRAAFWYGRHG
jgi:hypothetical protein